MKLTAYRQLAGSGWGHLSGQVTAANRADRETKKKTPPIPHLSFLLLIPSETLKYLINTRNIIAIGCAVSKGNVEQILNFKSTLIKHPK